METVTLKSKTGRGAESRAGTGKEIENETSHRPIRPIGNPLIQLSTHAEVLRRANKIHVIDLPYIRHHDLIKLTIPQVVI
ncbi:hypothetical protein EVAR_81101_1 [Eumeta japonica]|uniref:Uncharacterized protein n=1 Tax=Eumeta variegata TaxID=151549 RepID=A0A4C1T6S0_EUMVA|nr:hypothetical protein EVAR_81101_1 [Eumeta japonica]